MTTTRKINLPLDEELIRRVRILDSHQERTDSEVIEHALIMYLGDRAFDDALARGPLSETKAEQLAREELNAARRTA